MTKFYDVLVRFTEGSELVYSLRELNVARAKARVAEKMAQMGRPAIQSIAAVALVRGG
jgi:hypothetical protein